MLRETGFVVGGVITLGLGIALWLALLAAGAGLPLFEAWLAGGIAVGFGAFFVHVGREEGRDRRERLRALEGEDLPRRPPPPT